MAVYPIAPGHPDFASNSSTSPFIPEIWSTKLVVKFYQSTIFGSISNTDYEGEIKNYGDKVIIRTVPDTVISDYAKGQSLTYASPETTTVELQIDKGKYFAFSCDDVDKKQADINFVEKWSSDAAEQMKITIDSDILNSVYADAHASNKDAAAGALSGAYNLGASGAPVGITKTNVIDYIVDCGTVLSEQNVPETGRWIVIPAWMANYLKKSDLKDASLTGDSVSPMRNGRIGMIDQFTIYVSNNYTSVADSGGQTAYNILFGTNHAITFAAQMTKMETLRNPNTFGDLIRGLNVYGYKVIKSEALGVLYAYKA